jgi:PHD finger protein 20
LQSGKIVLKSLSVPSIFPWNKLSVVVSKASLPASETEKTDEDKKSEEKKEEEPAAKPVVSEIEKNLVEAISVEKEQDVKVEAQEKPKKNTSSSAKKKKTITPSPIKPKKSSKRLSAKLSQTEVTAKKTKTSTTPPVEQKCKPKELPIETTPKKKNALLNFIPGSSIEAQNFDGKWLPVKIIEVDTEEREVLVRSCDKNNKSKIG